MPVQRFGITRHPDPIEAIKKGAPRSGAPLYCTMTGPALRLTAEPVVTAYCAAEAAGAAGAAGAV